MTSPSSPLPASLRKSSHADSDESDLQSRQRALSPGASLPSLPFRVNPAISSLYASTSSAGSSVTSGTSTPTMEKSQAESMLYPSSGGRASIGSESNEIRTLIQRAFAPHIAVLASADIDNLLQSRGLHGGFLQLVRPFGESVSGRVIVRDSIGANRTWDDFGVRFISLRQGINTAPVRRPSRPSLDSRTSEGSLRGDGDWARRSSDAHRVGGSTKDVEDVVEKHLDFTEYQNSREVPVTSPAAFDSIAAVQLKDSTAGLSLFYTLYLRRLLSGLPLTPHETFSHPVACVIVASSRNASPIEEFKRLYTSSSTGNDRLPQWVSNDFLRYYVLVHDEDNDDISKSLALYEQMKRNFGLHCHLLRLRSSSCVPTDDDSIRLPTCEWMTAAEESDAIQRHELSDQDEDVIPCLHESDANAVKTFVRELVTQSIVPGMERLCAQWNEQIATKRKGLSGRLMSVGKRWGFGLGRNSNTQVSAASSSNYDSLQGFYRPDTPEALMRKLADYAFMLRDFKLAQTTFDVLRSDFEHDKAWKYYAGANEMYLISTMLNIGNPINKRLESIQRWLEGAVHSYMHRCDAPFYALRTLLLAFEVSKARQSLPLDETIQWAARVLDTNLIGPIGTALLMERIASCYTQKGGMGVLHTGSRTRKVAIWHLLAAEAWSRVGKTVQAERNLSAALQAYGITSVSEIPGHLVWMKAVLQQVHDAIQTSRRQASGGQAQESLLDADIDATVEETKEDLHIRSHRRGNSLLPVVDANNESSSSLSPIRSRDKHLEAEEGFEPSSVLNDQ